MPLNVDWTGNENTSLNVVIYYDTTGVKLTNINAK